MKDRQNPASPAAASAPTGLGSESPPKDSQTGGGHTLAGHTGGVAYGGGETMQSSQTGAERDSPSGYGMRPHASGKAGADVAAAGTANPTADAQGAPRGWDSESAHVTDEGGGHEWAHQGVQVADAAEDEVDADFRRWRDEKMDELERDFRRWKAASADPSRRPSASIAEFELWRRGRGQP